MDRFRIVLAGAAFGAIALAAPSAFAQAPVSWTGVYVGGHIGKTWADVDWGLAYEALPADDLPGTFSFNHDSIIGGGQLGLQFQTGKWVLGGELSLSGVQSSSAVNGVKLFADLDQGTLETKVDWMLLATAKLGYAADKWLAYVKGGYAGAMISVSSNDNVPPSFGMQDRDVHHGWTVGGGLEYMIAPGVTFGVEYSYVKLEADFSSPIVVLDGGSPLGVNAASDVETSIHSVSARVNFLFGGR